MNPKVPRTLSDIDSLQVAWVMDPCRELALITADAYEEAGDDRRAAEWREKGEWYATLIADLKLVESGPKGTTLQRPLGGWTIHFTRKAASIVVSVPMLIRPEHRLWWFAEKPRSWRIKGASDWHWRSRVRWLIDDLQFNQRVMLGRSETRQKG